MAEDAWELSNLEKNKLKKINYYKTISIYPQLLGLGLSRWAHDAWGGLSQNSKSEKINEG